MTVSDQEFEAVCALDTEERYAHFVKRVCEEGTVWALKASDGFVIMGDDDGLEYLPVWPDDRYADAYGGAGEKAEAIPLDAWMTRWLPGLERDRSGVAIFPIEGDPGAVVTLEQLRSDLEAELAKSD